MAASEDYPAGSTGGSATHFHTISGTVDPTTLTEEQMPAHRHQLRPADTPSPAGGKIAEGSGGQDAYVYSEYTGESQPHTHALTGPTGSTNSLPPYYVLAMIMRCA